MKTVEQQLQQWQCSEREIEIESGKGRARSESKQKKTTQKKSEKKAKETIVQSKAAKQIDLISLRVRVCKTKQEV